MKSITKIICILLLASILQNCAKREWNNLYDNKPPTVTTNEITEVTHTSATAGGTFKGLNISEMGICYGVNDEPTIENSKVIFPVGASYCNLTNLTAATTYFVRAYAINAQGTSYGKQKSFITIPYALATITTRAITDITISTATSGGNVKNDGGLPITEKGICYSTKQNPTIADSKVISTETTEYFTCFLTNLTSDINYYVRTYAVNSLGTSYGEQQSFVPFAVRDVDGNFYHSVTIGTQKWFLENLSTTHYRNGESIELTSDFNNISIGAAYQRRYYYNKNYAFYNRLAVNDTRNLCPIDWHVPSESDWKTLSDYLGGETIAGGKMKDTINWLQPNTGATNESGFTAWPNFGTAQIAFFWSSTIYGNENMSYRLYFNESNLSYSKTGNTYGFTVRCIKD